MSQRVEDIIDNIVKIVDNKGSFQGTGFLIEIKQVRYCITCHHCICRLKEIFVERDSIKCSVEWMEELSDMGKDIAVLKVSNCNDIKSLKYGKEAMAQFPVFVWGFSYKNLETFPDGAPVENGTLSSAPFLFSWKEENIGGTQMWNMKPQVKVYVFQFSGKFDLGFSGAPVSYTGNTNIVGIFTAKDNDYGYVIPIQTLLEKFENKFEYKLPKKDNDYNLVEYSVSDLKTIGWTLNEKRKYNEAIKWFDKALDIDPNNIDALNGKGATLNNLEKYEQAAKFLDRALNIDPNNVNVLKNKGLALKGLRRYKEAIDFFDKALAVNPNYAKSLRGKGSALSRLGKYDEAIECFDKVLAIDPNYSDALKNKGRLLSKLERDDEAIEYFDKALAVNPDDINALKGKGDALNRLGKRREAKECYDKVLAIRNT